MCLPLLSGSACNVSYIYGNQTYFTTAVTHIVLNCVLGVFVVCAALLAESKARIKTANFLVHLLLFLGCCARALTWLLLLFVSADAYRAYSFFIFFLGFAGMYPTVNAAFFLVLGLWWDAVTMPISKHLFVRGSNCLYLALSFVNAILCTVYDDNAFFWTWVVLMFVSCFNTLAVPIVYYLWHKLYKTRRMVDTKIESFFKLLVPLFFLGFCSMFEHQQADVFGHIVPHCT